MSNSPSVRVASIWAILEQLVRQGAMFVVSLILARLLTPADFGLVALVLFFSNFGIALIQTGLQAALLRLSDSSHVEEGSIFWYCLAASTLFGILLVLASPAIGSWFDQPDLVPLMAAAATQLVFAAFGVVPTALLNRSFQIRPIALSALAATAISGTIGIWAALRGFGPWAIALHLVVNQALTSIFLFGASGWRPTFTFDRSQLKRNLQFGSYINASSALDVLYTSGFAVIIGKLHGFVALGLYNRAQGTQQLPGNVIGAIISRLAVPLFSRHLDDEKRLRDDMRTTVELAMLFNLPAMAFLGSASADILVVLFGEQWRPAAPVLSLLAIGGAFVPLHIVNLQLMIAQGRSDAFFIVETLKKAVGITLVVAGSLFGVIGLAVSQVAFNAVAFVINARVGGGRIGFGALQQVTVLSREVVVATAIAAVNMVIVTSIDGALARLAFGLLLSGLLFCLLAWSAVTRFQTRADFVAAKGDQI